MPWIANPVSPVRLWDAPPNIRPGGEIGRHNGLKIRRLEKGVPVRFRFWAPVNLVNTPLVALLAFAKVGRVFHLFSLFRTVFPLQVCQKSVKKSNDLRSAKFGINEE